MDIKAMRVERVTRILVLNQLGALSLLNYSSALTDPESAVGRTLKEMSNLLPSHYIEEKLSNPELSKVVSFVYSQLLIFVISEVESFIQDILIAVICKHPEKIGKSTIDMKKINELGSLEAINNFSAKKYVNEIMYKRPSEYKKEIMSIISADDCIISDFWPKYVEAKARRDIGVHNSWIVNDAYLSKVREVGVPEPECKELSVSFEYFIGVSRLSTDLMRAIGEHCEKKFVN